MLGECVSSFPPLSVLHMRLHETVISFTNENVYYYKWSIPPTAPIPPLPTTYKITTQSIAYRFYGLDPFISIICVKWVKKTFTDKLDNFAGES